VYEESPTALVMEYDRHRFAMRQFEREIRDTRAEISKVEDLIDGAKIRVEETKSAIQSTNKKIEEKKTEIKLVDQRIGETTSALEKFE
jgi:chromosome segregation ATPase